MAGQQRRYLFWGFNSPQISNHQATPATAVAAVTWNNERSRAAPAPPYFFFFISTFDALLQKALKGRPRFSEWISRAW
ncbi:hypothetical protein LRS06_22390, partial [Hymenobacter sp. J193]|uniref:hypothetical protein n=1 Tax=Hymenobacter sp. J193 TaxID=2898429 RepID=UPI0021513EFA